MSATHPVIFKFCKVVGVTNDGTGRIEVVTYPEDRIAIKEEGVQYAYPLMPKMFWVQPQIDECVITFFAQAENGNSIRVYIGPFISYPQFMGHEPFNYAKAILDENSDNTLLRNKKAINNTAPGEVFADTDDIAVYGRKGTEIILKENDVRLRCGVRIGRESYGNENTKLAQPLAFDSGFNLNTPSYLKLKYSPQQTIVKSSYNETEYKYNSTATLVADQINLIGNNTSPWFNTADPDELINDETMQKIISEAHVLPYGDVLVEFLKEFLFLFKNHAHPWIGHTTILPSGKEGFWDYITGDGLNKMLSKSVRIN
jgi:hypothetical protein